MENVKCVAVGDGAVGKTCLLITYCKKVFPVDYIPTGMIIIFDILVFDNYQTNIDINGKTVNLGLWDTAGQEDYDRLRHLSYPNTDIFFFCFDLTNAVSLANIELKWYSEVNKFWQKSHEKDKTPLNFILVGTKLDARNDAAYVAKLSSEGKEIVTTEKGQEMADKLHAKAYVECSAKEGTNLNGIFTSACEYVLNARAEKKKAQKKKGCTLL